MQKLVFSLVCFLCFTNALTAQENDNYLLSGKRNIKVYIDNKALDWRIDPSTNPDVLQVYCEHEYMKISFVSDKDSIDFLINDKDTIEFIIEYNNDSAYTKIVGVKEFPNTISSADKVFHLSNLWSEVKYNFVNMDKLSFNWDSLYLSYIPKVCRSSNDYEYYQILKQFMATLHDGHTEILRVPPNLGVYFDYAPISLMNFNDKIYVTRIKKGIGYDSTFVGSEIIKVSGVEINRYLQDSIFPYYSASTKQHLLMQAIPRIPTGYRMSPFNITVKKRNGDICIMKLKRDGEATRSVDDDYWGTSISFDHEPVKLQWMEDSIVLLTINSFNQEDVIIDKLKNASKEIRHAKAVIIDLRKNGGGSTLVGWYLQSMLTTKDSYFLNFAWDTRINDGVKRANGNWKSEYKAFSEDCAVRHITSDTIFIEDTIPRIEVPTAILIGCYTFSAAEDFLVNIFNVPERPIIIGQPSGGSTGSPLVINDLPNGGIARICTKRIYYPFSDKMFVNEGIQPDIVVTQSFYDFEKGIDTVLRKAIDYLSGAN